MAVTLSDFPALPTEADGPRAVLVVVLDADTEREALSGDACEHLAEAVAALAVPDGWSVKYAAATDNAVSEEFRVAEAPEVTEE